MPLLTVSSNHETEQRRIAAKVDQLMALVDALESHLAASRSTVTRLMDALVAKITQQT